MPRQICRNEAKAGWFNFGSFYYPKIIAGWSCTKSSERFCTLRLNWQKFDKEGMQQKLQFWEESPTIVPFHALAVLTSVSGYRTYSKDYNGNSAYFVKIRDKLHQLHYFFCHVTPTGILYQKMTRTGINFFQGLVTENSRY